MPLEAKPEKIRNNNKIYLHETAIENGSELAQRLDAIKYRWNFFVGQLLRLMPFSRFNRLIVVSFNLNKNLWRRKQNWQQTSRQPNPVRLHFHMIAGILGYEQEHGCERDEIILVSVDPHYLLNRNHTRRSRAKPRHRMLLFKFAFGLCGHRIRATYYWWSNRISGAVASVAVGVAKPQYTKWQNQPLPLHRINIGQLFINCS